MPDLSVSALDVGILIAYLAGTRIFFGWYSARKARGGGSEAYFLAGRSLRWPIIGLSFYVSNMSGSSFVGMPGSGYAEGIAVFNYEWLPAPILVFFVLFLLPGYWSRRVSTAPEFLEARFGPASRRVFSAFLLLANIFIDAAAALYAGATVFQVLFPEVPLVATIVVLSLLAGIYIAVGGLEAAVINDALQAVMIGLGGMAIAVLTWMAVPSWSAVVDLTPADHLHLFQPATDEALPWPGVFTGVLIVGLYFWCMNQFIIQRALGAESLEQARYGAIFAGLLKLPNLFLLVLPGVMGIVIYPELDRPDLVFPTLAFDLLPVGFRGLMLAALAAAILSSLESILNSAATLFTLDFYRSLFRGVSDEHLVRVGRISTMAFMVLAAAWAPQITRFPTLWQYLQSILSYITPPVVAVFILGVFWGRTTAPAAFWILVAGVPVGGIGWVANEILGWTSLHFLYASGILFALSVGLGIVLSLLTEAPDPARVEGLLWRPSVWTEETARLRRAPWWVNYRWQAIGLLGITGILVIWWA